MPQIVFFNHSREKIEAAIDEALDICRDKPMNPDVRPRVTVAVLHALLGTPVVVPDTPSMPVVDAFNRTLLPRP